MKEILAKELKEQMMCGWSESEREHWDNYLEEEIKPYYPNLYKLLKKVRQKP